MRNCKLLIMNELKNCKLKNYNRWVIAGYKCVIFAIFGITFSSCSKTICISEELQKVADEVWIDSDSALVHLAQLDTTNYSDYERNYWHLQYQHAYMRAYQQPMKEPNPSIDSLLTFFTQNENPLITGEMYYVKATVLFGDGLINLSNRLMQQAGAEWEKIDVAPIKKGMLLKKMGDIAYASELYQVALDYFQQSIDVLCETDCPIFYICKTYSFMGNIYQNLSNDKCAQECYHKAIDSAGSDSTLYYEMLFMKYYCDANQYSDSVVSVGTYLVDSLGCIDEAINLANWFICLHNPISAKKYLEIAQGHSRQAPRHKMQLRYLLGHYLFQIGNVEAAYHHMCRVYESMFNQNIEDRNNFNFETTHQIEREQQALEQERLRQHRQLLALSLLLLTISLVAIILGGVLRMRKNKIAALDKQNQLLMERNAALEEKQQLENEVIEKRAQIRAQLQQRIELSKHLSIYHSQQHQLPPDTPDWLNEFIKANEFSSKHNSDQLIEWVNSAYYKCLDRLQQTCPSLTATDLQFIALVVLDFDATDISILQNIGIGAVNNRQSGIKRKLDIPSDKSLRDWLMQFLHQ